MTEILQNVKVFARRNDDNDDGDDDTKAIAIPRVFSENSRADNQDYIRMTGLQISFSTLSGLHRIYYSCLKNMHV